MREKTSEFAEATLEEAVDFAKKIKTHGIELHEQLKNHFDLLTDDKQEEEMEAKEADLGKVLLDFLVFEDREEIQ